MTIDFKWGLRIPLRDGTQLHAALYRSRAATGPAACLFTRTPYTIDRVHPRALYLAKQGFPVLVVDVRGRGDSQGEFRPFIQEAQDGFDVAEWLARQSFCNGQVAMFGSSYGGYDQWATAKEFPPHLVSIAPAVAAAPGIEGEPMRSNVFCSYVTRWLTEITGHTQQQRLFDDREFWRDQFRAWYESGRPFKELDRMIGNPLPAFQEWLTHPMQGAYWDAYRPTPEQYARLDLPILTITGCYDSAQLGALHYYREHLRHAPPEALAKHFLIIGPWDHFVAAPKAEFGGLKFGPASLLDVMKLHVEWYDWTLRDGSKPAFLQKNVAYYVMGAEKWRYADTLEAVTARYELFYLDSSGAASQLASHGALTPTRGTGPADAYLYDPRDLSIAEVESQFEYPQQSAPQYALLNPTFPSDSLVEQTQVYANEGKVLVYHSQPFSQDTELSGFFKLTAWIAIDQPDTDFIVSVHELTREGRSILLTADFQRARHRESLCEESLIGTTEPLRYEFNHFTFVSRQLQQGSRLRLVIGPVNSIYYQKNYNSGKPVAEESIEDARPVRVRLFHDESHPSALQVPFGQPEDKMSSDATEVH